MGSQHERIPADRQWQTFTIIMRAHENDQLLIRILSKKECIISTSFVKGGRASGWVFILKPHHFFSLQKVFIAMRRLNLRTQKFNKAIYVAGQEGKIDEVERMYQFLGNRADEYTYSTVIRVAGNYRRMDLAESAYEAAKKSGKANVVVFTTMINVAGRNRHMGLLEDAYFTAKELGCFDAMMFASMITAAGNNERMDLAHEAYNIAQELGMVNGFTINKMKMVVRNNNNRLARPPYYEQTAQQAIMMPLENPLPPCYEEAVQQANMMPLENPLLPYYEQTVQQANRVPLENRLPPYYEQTVQQANRVPLESRRLSCTFFRYNPYAPDKSYEKVVKPLGSLVSSPF